LKHTFNPVLYFKFNNFFTEDTMKKTARHFTIFYTLFTAALALSGCNNSDNSDSGDNNDTDSACTPSMPSGSGEAGDFCMEMEDCKSGFCATYSHAPADPDAVCKEAPPIGDIHIMATVTDFMTDQIISNQELKLGGALDVSQNPAGFPPAQILTSDKDGRIDVILSGDVTTLPLGLVVVGEKEGYYPTSTGLVKPEAGCNMYVPATRNADIKIIKKTDLSAMSDALKADFPDESDRLPLGEKGGVLGVIKHVVSGDGVKDAVLKSANDSTSARIYYLNEARDGFTTGKTSSNGIFVIMQPGLAEEFNAFIGSKKVSRRSATAGETSGVLFATTVQVEDQE
jgi:hypothetical protein